MRCSLLDLQAEAGGQMLSTSPYSPPERAWLSSALTRVRRVAGVIVVAGAAIGGGAPETGSAQGAATVTASSQATPDSIRDFGALVTRLSEQGGYFDTDNLISNESSYLHVIGALQRYGVRGGAYIGVGPDQNFSYIAAIRPRVAFLIDIRRDNMLQHLMFKGLFARSRNRAEYLAMWLGKKAPAAIDSWANRSITDIVAYLDSTPSTPAAASAAKSAVLDEARKSGVMLSANDLSTIERFHQAFISAGLSLRFNTAGRAPQPYYPTLRQLVLEKDRDGRMASYLASESDFHFLKGMQRRNMLVPVVGDLGGTRALTAIGAYIKQRGDKLSAFYASNAEDYVMRDGNFPNYIKSIAAMPRDDKSVFIRSYFGGGGHAENVSGYYSTQLLQRVDVFLLEAARYNSYRQLVQSNYLPLTPSGRQ